MTDPKGRAGHQGPVPWHHRRPIDIPGARYCWCFHAPDSDLRLVYRMEDDLVLVGDVRNGVDSRVTELTHQYECRTRGGTFLGHSSTVSGAARLVALHDRVARLGAQRGTAQVAEFLTAGSPTARSTDWAWCLQLASGDPGRWWAQFRRSPDPLSGRFGDPTAEELLTELGGHPDLELDPVHTLPVLLGRRYTEAFHQAWKTEFLRIARERATG